MTVLVVEDHPELAAEIATGLGRQGMRTVVASSGQAAFDRAGEADIVLLDLGLPDYDGLEVCRSIRNSSDVPIIIMSGRGEEIDRILGLKMGADDYVVKPYSLRELAARVEAVLRRTARAPRPGGPSPVLESGSISLDQARRKVHVDGREVVLTRKEFDILALLASGGGRVFTREELMESIWGHDGAGDTRTLGVHMTTLRRKLGVPELIETVRGVGFRFGG